jgi:hypothetical protein
MTPRTAAPTSHDTPLVWVLIPTMPSADEHLQYYGDYEQSRAEYARAFEALGLRWHWQPVHLQPVTWTTAPCCVCWA